MSLSFTETLPDQLICFYKHCRFRKKKKEMQRTLAFIVNKQSFA